MATFHKIVLSGKIPVNCYIISHGSRCLVMDPGYEGERIRAFLEANGLTAEGILLTHAHFDHIGALDCLSVPVHVHSHDVALLREDSLNGFERHGLRCPFPSEAIDVRPLEHGDEIPLGNDVLNVIHTPGHTGGCVCFRMGGDLFTGDTLFAGGVGRWDRPTASYEQMRQSVTSLIDAMPDDVRIHPGHGESGTIGEERRCNQHYLKWKTQS